MKRVLVVEDNAENFELIRFILVHNGYEVIGAVSGEQGLELAMGENPENPGL